MSIKHTTRGPGKLGKCAEWQVVDCVRQMFMDPFNFCCVLLRVGKADTNCMCGNLAIRLVEEI